MSIKQNEMKLSKQVADILRLSEAEELKLSKELSQLPEGIVKDTLDILSKRVETALNALAGNHVDTGFLDKMRIQTPAGAIEARNMRDSEYPGIGVFFVEPGTGEPGAILEYSPTAGCVQLRVYSKENPDEDPVKIYDMSYRKTVRKVD